MGFNSGFEGLKWGPVSSSQGQRSVSIRNSF